MKVVQTLKLVKSEIETTYPVFFYEEAKIDQLFENGDFSFKIDLYFYIKTIISSCVESTSLWVASILARPVFKWLT